MVFGAGDAIPRRRRDSSSTVPVFFVYKLPLRSCLCSSGARSASGYRQSASSTGSPLLMNSCASSPGRREPSHPQCCVQLLSIGTSSCHKLQLDLKNSRVSPSLRHVPKVSEHCSAPTDLPCRSNTGSTPATPHPPPPCTESTELYTLGSPTVLLRKCSLFFKSLVWSPKTPTYYVYPSLSPPPSALSAKYFIYNLTDLDDQRLSLGPVKAYWLRYGNIDVPSPDLIKAPVLSSNLVTIPSLGCYEDLGASTAYPNKRQFLLVAPTTERGFLRSVLSESCNRCCTLNLNPPPIPDSLNRILYGLTPHFMFMPSTIMMILLICWVIVAFALTNEFSRTRVHGTSLFDQDTLVEFPASLSNQDSIHSSSSSSLSRRYAIVSLSFLLNNMLSGTVEIHLVSRSIIVSIEADQVYLTDYIAKSSFSMSIAKAWIFTGQSGTSNTRGLTTQDSISSPMVAEALGIRSTLLTAVNLEIATLKFSDNSTLVRAINNDIQKKEIYGIVKDIQFFSSDFVDISVSSSFRRCNCDADRLAKTILGFSLVMDPIWAGSWA